MRVGSLTGLKPVDAMLMVWLVVEFVLVRRQLAEGARDEDHGSRALLAFCNVPAFLGAVLVIKWRIGVIPDTPGLLPWIGAAVMLAGILLRVYAIRSLGEFFSGHLQIQQDHRIVDTGPYACVRHPSYSAIMIVFLGIGIGLGDWIALLLLVVMPLIGLLYRMGVEERALLAAFGNDYLAYMRRTWRLVPYVY